MKIQDEYTWSPSRELTRLNEIPSEQRITIQHGTKKKHINVRACMHTHTQTQINEKYSIEEEQLTETGGGFTGFSTIRIISPDVKMGEGEHSARERTFL